MKNLYEKEIHFKNSNELKNNHIAIPENNILKTI